MPSSFIPVSYWRTAPLAAPLFPPAVTNNQTDEGQIETFEHRIVAKLMENDQQVSTQTGCCAKNGHQE